MTFKEITECAKGNQEFPDVTTEPDFLAYIAIRLAIEMYQGRMMVKDELLKIRSQIELAHSNMAVSYDWILQYFQKSAKIASIEMAALTEQDPEKLRALVLEAVNVYRKLENQKPWEGERTDETD